MPRLRRLLPLALLIGGCGAFWASGLGRLLSWEQLGANRDMLLAAIAAEPWRTAAAFTATYFLSTLLCIPSGALLMMMGGMLFGVAPGAALSALGAIAGAITLFAVVRFALADWVAARAGKRVNALRTRLERDGFRYLLMLRLIPLFPFWVTNLAPALAGMRTAPFVWSTILGVIPNAVLFAALGARAGEMLENGHGPTAAIVMAPSVLLPLGGVALLALTPMLLRRVRRETA